MNKKMITFVSIALAILIPGIATASIVMDSVITTTVSTTTTPIYIAPGPGYDLAHSQGFITMSSAAYSSTSSNITLELNEVPGTGNVTLYNAMEIVNDSSATNTTSFVFNSIPSGITIYYNATSENTKLVPSMSNPAVPNGGTVITDGTSYSIAKGVTSVYLTIEISGTAATGTHNMLFYYEI